MGWFSWGAVFVDAFLFFTLEPLIELALVFDVAFAFEVLNTLFTVELPI